MRFPYNNRRRRISRVKQARETTPKEAAKADAPRPRPKPVPVVNNRFSAALARFGAALLETSAIASTTSKGTKREDEFRRFLAERLPSKYGVTNGGIVDLLNQASPQLDALVFDQSRNFAFSGGEQDVKVLPAEALLVSIEVKSKLDAGEVMKSCAAAQKLRKFKPYRMPLAGSNVGKNVESKQARYLHCIFAYDTDLSETTWLQNESRRFHTHGASGEHLIDCVYVLKRGLINFTSNSGRLEDAEGSAVTSFYFSILNFIQRENKRREDTPYSEYASLLSGKWISLNSAADPTSKE
jgi:hypothetical protein